MDWLQFFASVVTSIAWPTAIVTLAVLLRSPLARLLPLIRTLKYKDLQIDLGEQLEAVKEQVEASSDASSNDPEEPTSTYKDLARIDPRAAVLSAWVPVELALKDLAFKRGLYTLQASPAAMAKRLQEHGLLDQVTYDTLSKLRAIRNEAAHLMLVSYDEAISMGEMCEWAVQKLKSAGAQL
ncbi:hypothetical protein D3C75_907710 [compost metagenome]